MHAVTYGVTRDQMMARHKANHIQVAYANSARRRPTSRSTPRRRSPPSWGSRSASAAPALTDRRSEPAMPPMGDRRQSQAIDQTGFSVNNSQPGPAPSDLPLGTRRSTLGCMSPGGRAHGLLRRVSGRRRRSRPYRGGMAHVLPERLRRQSPELDGHPAKVLCLHPSHEQPHLFPGRDRPRNPHAAARPGGGPDRGGVSRRKRKSSSIRSRARPSPS